MAARSVRPDARVPPTVSTVEGRAIVEYFQSQISDLVRAMNAPAEVRLSVRYVEPDRPRPGQVVYADGTEWDPGAGEGLYYWDLTGTWVFAG